jgi:hypothetical protein
MSNKWFSNRGQTIQAACAVIAVGVGFLTQWNNLTLTFDIVMFFKILFFPAAALLLFQLGKYVERRSTLPTAALPGKPVFDYQYLTPTIKVGSYHAVGEELGMRRITAISIKEEDVLSAQIAGAEIEVTGSGVFFSGGERTTQIKDKRFVLPAHSRAMKSENFSIFEFIYGDSDFSFVALSVDHINIPAQEVTLAVCLMKYRKPS